MAAQHTYNLNIELAFRRALMPAKIAPTAMAIRVNSHRPWIAVVAV